MNNQSIGEIRLIFNHHIVELYYNQNALTDRAIGTIHLLALPIKYVALKLKEELITGGTASAI